jgi:arginine decarboxylase
MPLHRLNEEPTHKAIIADLTCDSDGKIKTYVHPEEDTDYLPVHKVHENEDYLLGAFLVGAYQETLGDMHNLFGTTHVVSVENKDGALEFTRIVPGDTATEVLSYLEYNTDELRRNLKRWTEEAISINRISPKDRDLMLREYDESLKSYTYLGS